MDTFDFILFLERKNSRKCEKETFLFRKKIQVACQKPKGKSVHGGGGGTKPIGDQCCECLGFVDAQAMTPVEEAAPGSDPERRGLAANRDWHSDSKALRKCPCKQLVQADVPHSGQSPKKEQCRKSTVSLVPESPSRGEKEIF